MNGDLASVAGHLLEIDLQDNLIWSWTEVTCNLSSPFCSKLTT
jgi:hypothetical protein